jgi:hypothetical protein
MPRTLPVPQCVWTKVFRRIVAELERDPELKSVLGDRLRSWKGVPGDKSPFVPTAGRPVVRLTPNPAGVDWYSPDMHSGTLFVRVEIAVESTCIDDVMDLWDRIVTALTPADRQLCLDLIELGSETGEIVCDSPAFDPRPEATPEGRFSAQGRFHLEIVRPT